MRMKKKGPNTTAFLLDWTFHNLKTSNSFFREFYVLQKCRSMRFEAIKWLKCSVGFQPTLSAAAATATAWLETQQPASPDCTFVHLTAVCSLNLFPFVSFLSFSHLLSKMNDICATSVSARTINVCFRPRTVTPISSPRSHLFLSI